VHANAGEVRAGQVCASAGVVFDKNMLWVLIWGSWIAEDAQTVQ
jgi:hypothetical protein